MKSDIIDGIRKSNAEIDELNEMVKALPDYRPSTLLSNVSVLPDGVQ